MGCLLLSGDLSAIHRYLRRIWGQDGCALTSVWIVGHVVLCLSLSF